MRKILYLLVLVFFSGCGIINFGSRSVKAKLQNTQFKTTVPFESKSNLQVVTVNVQGVDLKFIWDTGAGVTVLTKQGAEKLNFEEYGNMTIRDSRGHKKRTPLIIIDSLKLGDLIFENVLTAVIEYPKESIINCIAYDGILGQNAIRLANWTVDYESQRFTVSDSSIDMGKNDLIIPFKYNNSPRVNFTLGHAEVENILFDTGSNGLIDFPASLKEDLDDSLFVGKPSRFIDGTSQGVFGSSLDTHQILYPAKLKLDTCELKNHSIEFDKSGKGKIGQQIFRQWNSFSIDHQSQKIIFHGQKKELEIKPKFSVGFKKDSATFTLATMLMDHINYQSGLSIGDTLASINGQNLSDFIEPCDFFEWQSKTFNNLPDTIPVTNNHGETFTLIKSLPNHFKHLGKD